MSEAASVLCTGVGLSGCQTLAAAHEKLQALHFQCWPGAAKDQQSLFCLHLFTKVSQGLRVDPVVRST
jgi:hypothetical protein